MFPTLRNTAKTPHDGFCHWLISSGRSETEWALKVSIKNIKKSGWHRAPGSASGWHRRASGFVVTISRYRCWDEKVHRRLKIYNGHQRWECLPVRGLNSQFHKKAAASSRAAATAALTGINSPDFYSIFVFIYHWLVYNNGGGDKVGR